MPKNMEIERKYLLADDSWKDLAVRSYDICQGYLSRDPDRTIRIRQKGEKAFLTIKSRPNENGFAHFEFEKEVELSDAAELFKICLPGVIEKTRYIVPLEGELIAEVDVFHGRLEGLAFAEVELESEAQMFTKPSFLGEEVTGNPAYQNANL